MVYSKPSCKDYYIKLLEAERDWLIKSYELQLLYPWVVPPSNPFNPEPINSEPIDSVDEATERVNRSLFGFNKETRGLSTWC